MDSKQAKAATAPKKNTPAFTLIAKIKSGQAETLRRMGAEFAGRKTIGDYVPLVHFFRLVVIGDEYLLFASNYDGNVDDYLNDFYTAEVTPGGPAQGSFEKWMKYLEGFPGTGSREAFAAFWKSHKIEEVFNYSRYPGVTVKEIEKALRVQEAFQSVLDEPGAAEALKQPALKALLAVASD